MRVSSTKQALKQSELPGVSELVSLQMPTQSEHLCSDSLHHDAIICETTGIKGLLNSPNTVTQSQ